MREPVYIVDEIQEVVTATAAKLFADGVYTQPIYYMYGHPIEIVKRLQELTNSITFKDKKFPLIALFTDIPVTVGRIPGMYGEAELQIIIAVLTQQNYTAPDRMANNFKPVLYPIRDQLLYQLGRHRQFTYGGELQYTSIDRFFWGKEGLYGNSANIYNDFIDAIELKNIKLNIKNAFCLPDSLRVAG